MTFFALPAWRHLLRRPLPSLLLLATLSACGGGKGSAPPIATAPPAAQTPTTIPAPTPPATSPPAPTPQPTLPAAPTLPPAPTLTTPPAPVLPDTPLATTPTPTPAPTPLPAPAAFRCAEGALTCIEVTSSSSQTQANVPLTFGQPFKAGDWLPSTEGLVAKVAGQTIALQTDELATHRDGSARFAVLSAQLDKLQPGETRIINLYRGAKTPSAAATLASPDWNLVLQARMADGTLLVAEPQAQLLAQMASASERRLAGPLVQEYTLSVPFKNPTTGAIAPHLTARLHTRLMEGGQRIRTDVVLENTRTWTTAPGNLSYTLSIVRNGSTLFTQPPFTHYPHARWHQVVWTGGAGAPQARVRHYMPYFLASKAVWNYDLRLQIPESVLAAFDAQYQQAKTDQASLGPMANLLLTPAFGTTGGRVEIGPLPQWTAMYLITQDERMRAIMLAHADAGASVPVHYRDDATHQPLDLDHYPKVSTWRGSSEPALPALVNGATIWDPDTSHQASYAYVPYLITGDAFYQEEMAFWAAWNLTAMNPAYRGAGQGLLWEDQVRGQAWSLRALGEAARSLPDGHPMKAYFRSRLANSLEWFYQNWVVKPLADVWPMGSPVNPYSTGTMAPWQNDFWAIVMAQHAEAGEPRAQELLAWVSQFGVGRFTHEAQGLCVAKAPAYYLQLKNTAQRWIGSWTEFAQVNYPGLNCNGLPVEPDSYPASAGGYAANARAMLAVAADRGIADAASAYTLWKARTPLVDKDYPNNPTWAIVPR